ncbi:thiamine biosynthesis protein ThiJ [Nocardioides sp. Soil805]|nr:thiamine biosynthesis protein ThiJ [Nocardioides sp. Soil805]
MAFDSMEVLDYAGPYEVFNVANEVDPTSPFEVSAIGVRAGALTGRGGFTVLPSATIAEATAPDILIVPGGSGTRPLLHEPNVIDWIRSCAEHSELVLSVCTGALVLAAAGMLDGCSATTHHGAFDELLATSPTTRVVRDQRFVQCSERVWTSGGISAGIDLSLHIVGLLSGARVRDLVVAEMEWGW